MNRRSISLAVLSVAVGVALIVLLVRLSRADILGALVRMETIDQGAFALLALLMGINTYLSSLKWRLIDGFLRDKDEIAPSRAVAFAVTSLGIALGQVLPVQVSVSIARTIGTWGSGRAVRRGTLATLCEQGFDFLIVLFLAVASFATYVLHGGAAMWMTFALTMLAVTFLAVGSGTRLLSTIAMRNTADKSGGSRWRRTLSELSKSGLLNKRLGYQLTSISAARFTVLILMAGQTTRAIHSTLPLWHLAVAMPFVVLTASLGITPGGLGLTEFTYATILSVFGTPLAVTTEWALANRVLTIGAAVVVAILGGALLISKAPARLRAIRMARAMR